MGFDHCLPCPFNTYRSQVGCSFCPDGSISYSYAETTSITACEPCAEEGEICSFSRWIAEQSSRNGSLRVIYDFSEDSSAAFKAFQNLLTNPMVPKLMAGFWGQPEFSHERWQKPTIGGGNSLRMLLEESHRKLSEEFELLPDKIIANYSAFRGWRVYECVDKDTCLGTSSEYLLGGKWPIQKRERPSESTQKFFPLALLVFLPCYVRSRTTRDTAHRGVYPQNSWLLLGSEW